MIAIFDGKGLTMQLLPWTAETKYNKTCQAHKANAQLIMICKGSAQPSTCMSHHPEFVQALECVQCAQKSVVRAQLPDGRQACCLGIWVPLHSGSLLLAELQGAVSVFKTVNAPHINCAPGVFQLMRQA